eukprot:1159542-Pelagomonas_calceolata.AAC.5
MADEARQASITQNKIDVEALNYHKAAAIRTWEKEQAHQIREIVLAILARGATHVWEVGGCGSVVCFGVRAGRTHALHKGLACSLPRCKERA